MAIQILAQMQFPQLSVVAYYDDVALQVTRVEVNNNGATPVTATFKKLDKPTKTFSQTFQPNTSVGYNVPNGFKFVMGTNEYGETEIVSPFTLEVGGA